MKGICFMLFLLMAMPCLIHAERVQIDQDTIQSLADWNQGQETASFLDSAGWHPQSDWEIVHYWIAKRMRGHLVINWPLTKRVLIAVIRSPRNEKELENAVYALVGLGIDEILPELLKIFDDQGNKEMAEAYLNCQNALLYNRARDWAVSNGYSISSGSWANNPTTWGGF